ncbi:hypothetical protein [Anaplasma phagocytophilum]|uniref:hypothetical protein n=1 Tax=Anaplasma phagocytophilum TaxID=948 RepID=UPI00200CC31A|nr:hypothetical protein [Anaplasma phagocytophilum]UQD54698.1 hypothetical protein ESP60_05505 [Anaplasma phagocytophilum]
MIYTHYKPKHITILVNEYGTLQDSVTLKDILEEIVIGISDEHHILPDSLSVSGTSAILMIELL